MPHQSSVRHNNITMVEMSLQILLVAVVFFLMLGLGSTVTPTSLKSILTNPKAPLVRFLSQFGIMPLTAFTLAKILNVSDAQVISVILVGSSPVDPRPTSSPTIPGETFPSPSP